MENIASSIEMHDRRSSQRLKTRLTSTLRRPSFFGKPQSCDIIIVEKNMSGALIATPHPFKKGEKFKLDWTNIIDARTGGNFFVGEQVTAEIVHAIPERPSDYHAIGNYLYGIKLINNNIKLKSKFVSNGIFWLVITLFILAVSNVVYLKQSNVEYFWYNPLFNIYSLVISFYILSRFVLSIFYKPPVDIPGYEPSVSVIIACKNEEDSIGRTIDCIFDADYPTSLIEIIAVNDGSTDNTLIEMREAKKRHSQLSIIDFEKNRGKRHGMAEGAKLARGEILVYIDSDSFIRKNTIRKLVQGFHDPNVGAVCGHANVQNARKNLLTKMQEVRYYVAFRIVKAAESLFDTVSCCSGCLAAYRRSYVMPILDTWLNQRFLGTEATFGDDRSLTNYMLRRYRVIYHADAVCTTLVPESYRVFFRQQLRWKKSWIRESLIASAFMWKRHPMAAFFYYLGVLFPLVAPIIVFNALVLPYFVDSSISYLYIYGAALMAFLYSLVYLARVQNSMWIYGVFFSLFYMLILVWQTYYALITVRENHWGTR